SASDDVVVTVAPADGSNLPPTVSAGPDRIVTSPATVAALAGSVVDDGLPLGGGVTSNWTVVSGPGSATFSAAGEAATAVTVSAIGTYVLRLTASDGTLSASDDVVVRLTAPNQAPVVSA